MLIDYAIIVVMIFPLSPAPPSTPYSLRQFPHHCSRPWVMSISSLAQLNFYSLIEPALITETHSCFYQLMWNPLPWSSFWGHVMTDKKSAFSSNLNYEKLFRITLYSCNSLLPFFVLIRIIYFLLFVFSEGKWLQVHCYLCDLGTFTCPLGFFSSKI